MVLIVSIGRYNIHRKSNFNKYGLVALIIRKEELTVSSLDYLHSLIKEKNIKLKKYLYHK